MKTIIKRTLAVLLALLCLSSLIACGGEENVSVPETPETPDTDGSSAVDGSASEDSTVSKTGLWKDALYLKDITFGEGAKTITVTVKANGQSVTFTLKTDKTTVGDALMEHKLITGEEGDFGLYIKTVNGILADYDVDQTYWAFYIDGEYAVTGVDGTEISEGTAYTLERTK